MRLSFCLPGLLSVALLAACDTTRETTSGQPNPTVSRVPLPAPATPPGFRQELVSGSYRYVISTSGPAGQRLLSVRAEQGGQELTTAQDTIGGEVQEALLAHLTAGPGDELLVFTGSGGLKTAVRGYWFGGQDWERMEPLPKPAGAAAQGYRGQDRYEVRGNTLLRTFPVYQPNDAACCPSGGRRTIGYRMAAGSLAFRPVEVITEPKSAR